MNLDQNVAVNEPNAPRSLVKRGAVETWLEKADEYGDISKTYWKENSAVVNWKA